MVANKQILGSGSISGPGNIMGTSNSGPLAGYGSLVFQGNQNSLITFSNQSIAWGSYMYDKWTIEWWQKETDTNSAPRPWSFGASYSTGLGVSFESGNINLWRNSNPTNIGSVGSLSNAWHHFAVVRDWDASPNTYLVYKDGTLVGGLFADTLTSLGSDLILGASDSPNNSDCFGGKIAGFHFTSEAKYTGNFTPSTNPLSYQTANTKMLLLAVDSGSRLTSIGSATITAQNSYEFDYVTWDSDNPWVA